MGSKSNRRAPALRVKETRSTSMTLTTTCLSYIPALSMKGCFTTPLCLLRFRKVSALTNPWLTCVTAVSPTGDSENGSLSPPSNSSLQWLRWLLESIGVSWDKGTTMTRLCRRISTSMSASRHLLRAPPASPSSAPLQRAVETRRRGSELTPAMHRKSRQKGQFRSKSSLRC